MGVCLTGAKQKETTIVTRTITKIGRHLGARLDFTFLFSKGYRRLNKSHEFNEWLQGNIWRLNKKAVHFNCTDRIAWQNPWHEIDWHASSENIDEFSVVKIDLVVLCGIKVIYVMWHFFMVSMKPIESINQCSPGIRVCRTLLFKTPLEEIHLRACEIETWEVLRTVTIQEE